MKKIMSLILAGIFSYAAFAQSAPTAAETETINAKLNSYYEQVKNMSLTDRAQIDAACAAFVAESENKDMVKKLYDFAMADPIAYRKWVDARGRDVKNYQLRQWLVFYKRANDEARAFTLNQLAIAFEFSEAWKPQHWAVVEQNYESMKSAGWKVEGFAIGPHNILMMATRLGDTETVIDLPNDAIIAAGLEKYLPALEAALTKLGASKDDAKRAWLAYVRARKVLSPYQSETKNSAFWSRLLADEDAAYCDYKRM